MIAKQTFRCGRRENDDHRQQQMVTHRHFSVDVTTHLDDVTYDVGDYSPTNYSTQVRRLSVTDADTMR